MRYTSIMPYAFVAWIACPLPCLTFKSWMLKDAQRYWKMLKDAERLKKVTFFISLYNHVEEHV
jgi:hypothetical protein